MDINDRCNARCIFCSQKISGCERELSVSEATRIFSELRSLELRDITFAGGEPTLHSRIHDLVKKADSFGLRVGLVSNGIVFDTAFTERLLDSGCSEVALSVYGLSAKTHDLHTGVTGSFDKLMHTCQLIRESGMILRINLLVTRYNFKELMGNEGLRVFDEYFPALLRITNLVPQGSATSCFFELRIEPDEYFRLISHLRARKPSFLCSFQQYFSSLNPIYEELFAIDQSCTDALGIVPSIMKDGILLPCCYMSGDLKKFASGTDIVVGHEDSKGRKHSQCPVMSDYIPGIDATYACLHLESYL
ncbi:MAG: radical SAM protein [Candidatus Sabulitectum sp.]|nr:radical SAM protein [Candidatus Sabulitectum sp.]